VADGGPDWTLTIATKGGPGGGPALTIASGQESDALTSAKLGVSGNTLFLHGEECGNKAGTKTTFVESEYRWNLSGKTLRLTSVKNGCPDKVDQTILTAKPYTKQG
jgi:predicted double-glycine peptidase